MFVVPDADGAAKAWARTGVPVVKATDVEIASQGNKPLRVRTATAFFENAFVDFIQPVSKDGMFSTFLKSRRGGGMALVHVFAGEAALDAEVARLAAAGARPVLDSKWKQGPETARYVFFDTAKEGKYTLVLSSSTYRKPASAARRITQYAFAVNDLKAVSAYWARLGFPEMTYSHSDSSELVYRGRPGTFDMQLGWQRHGKVVYEWIQPTKGPSAYHEQIEKHGEGFHHFAFNVDDMDAGIKEWESFGFPFVMGGAWGVKGKSGSGRFAYHDLDACCGAEIELLWNYRAK